MGKDLLLLKGLELIDINFVYSKLFSNDMGHSGMIWNILGPKAIRNTFLARQLADFLQIKTFLGGTH